MHTGDLIFLPCLCPCVLAHSTKLGICERTPVVATMEAVTELGTINLRLCDPCARAVRGEWFHLIEGVTRS